MAEPSTTTNDRAKALRTLIEMHERPEVRDTASFFQAIEAGLPVEMWNEFPWVGDSLDAVARLERPLRDRGWRWLMSRMDDGTVKVWLSKGEKDQRTWSRRYAEAPREARARLLAVLRALLWEAEHG